MGRRGPKPMDVSTKALRNTLKASRERSRTTPPASSAPAVVQPVTEPRDFLAIREAYIDGVVKGLIVACLYLRWLCQLQRRMEQRAKADPTSAYVWSASHAVDICEFAERLPHAFGQWQNPLVRLEPVQVFLLTSLFGWRLRADLAVRRFRSCTWKSRASSASRRWRPRRAVLLPEGRRAGRARGDRGDGGEADRARLRHDAVMARRRTCGR